MGAAVSRVRFCAGFEERTASARRKRDEGSPRVRSFVEAFSAHARRSRLLFQKAFGEGTRVGIIAVEYRDYDPRRWCRFSQGVRTVVDELVAYVYAVVVFDFG